MSKPEPSLPLTPAVFHILLALFGKSDKLPDLLERLLCVLASCCEA